MYHTRTCCKCLELIPKLYKKLSAKIMLISIDLMTNFNTYNMNSLLPSVYLIMLVSMPVIRS